MKVYAGTDPATSPAEVAAHARRVEAAGYDGLHVSETVHDPFLLALLALQATERIVVRTSVALAFVRAVREALLNVERHAGVDTAVLTVHGRGGRTVVLVADEGVGFLPEQVARSRRGIRGSVVERMDAVGGSAVVTSHPGAGTTVRLVWPDG